jgi:hypothetical protein
MRVIFLDFDGVLHDAHATAGLAAEWPPTSVRARLPRAFTHARLLAQVLADAPDVRIIVTSAWRHHFPEPALARLVPELARWLGGTLPPGPRVATIRAWAHEHAVRSFIVLDADAQQYVQSEWPQLVLCNPVLGFAEPRVVEAVMRWLRGSDRSYAL